MPSIEVVFLRLFVEIFSMNEIVESLVDRLNTNLREAFQERASIRQYEGGQDPRKPVPVGNDGLRKAKYLI